MVIVDGHISHIYSSRQSLFISLNIFQKSSLEAFFEMCCQLIKVNLIFLFSVEIFDSPGKPWYGICSTKRTTLAYILSVGRVRFSERAWGGRTRTCTVGPPTCIPVQQSRDPPFIQRTYVVRMFVCLWLINF